MHLPIASILSILLSLLLACHCSLTRPYNEPQIKSLQQSEFSISPPPSIPPSHPLHPRKLSDLSLIQFDHARTLAPIQLAAPLLHHFYTQIQLYARGPWSRITPRIWVKISLGSITLLLSATDGHTVPWSFVAWFAGFMVGCVDRGYVGTFDSYWVSPEGEAGVVASFTCPLVGGGGTLNVDAKPFRPP